MHMRKRLLSTALCGSVLALAFGFPAAAQASQLYRPSSNWAVSKIVSNEAGGAYCALARRYSGDVVLTLARNSADESSFAIDFQKDMLDKSQNYYVGLQPAAGQARSFDVRPVSGKAMVIRLGRDYAFYDALSRSNRLDLDIGGEVYSFDITDLQQGQQRLNGCLAVMTEPAAGDEDMTAHMTPPPVAEEQEEIAEAAPALMPLPGTVKAGTAVKAPAYNMASVEIEGLREENRRLKNLIADMKQQQESPARVSGQDEARKVSAELNQKIRTLLEENDELRDQLAAKSATLDAIEPASGEEEVAPQALAELAALREENARLRRQVEDFTADVARFSREAEEAHRQLAMTSEQSASQQQAVNQEAMLTIARLEARLQTLEAEKAGLKKSLDAGNADDARLQAQIKALETQNAELKKSVEATASQSSGVSQHLAALEAENARLKLSLAEKPQPDQELQVRVHTLQTENETLKKALSGTATNNEAIQGRISALESENAELKKAFETASAESGTFNLRIQTLENENVTLRKSVETAAAGQQEISTRFAALKAEKDELQAALDKAMLGGDAQARISALEAQKAELQKTLDNVTASSKAALEKVAALQAENDSLKAAAGQVADSSALQARITVLETENATLKQALAGKADTAPLQERISALEIENDNLKAALANISTAAGDDTQFQADIAALQSENASLKQALESERARLTPLPAPVNDSAALAQLKITEEKLQAVITERDSLARQIETLQEVNPAAGMTMAAADWDMEQITRRYNEAEREVRRLGLQLEKDRQQCTTEKKQIESLLFDPEIASQEQASRMISMERELSVKKAELTEALDRIAVLEAKIRGGVQQVAYNAPVARPVMAQQAVTAHALATLEPAAGGPAAQAPVHAPAPVSRAPLAPAPVPAAIPSAGGNLAAIANLLKESNIDTGAGVQAADSSSLSWEGSGLFGSAEQEPMANAADFEKHIAGYLEKTKARCDGEFAAVPGAKEQGVGGLQVSSYEIACMGAGGNASASIVFVGKDGTFTTIAHEADVENMDKAMDARDKLVSALLQMKMAAN